MLGKKSWSFLNFNNSQFFVSVRSYRCSQSPLVTTDATVRLLWPSASILTVLEIDLELVARFTVSWVFYCNFQRQKSFFLSLELEALRNRRWDSCFSTSINFHVWDFGIDVELILWFGSSFVFYCNFQL